jgi:hypothetical protein
MGIKGGEFSLGLKVIKTTSTRNSRFSFASCLFESSFYFCLVGERVTVSLLLVDLALLAVYRYHLLWVFYWYCTFSHHQMFIDIYWLNWNVISLLVIVKRSARCFFSSNGVFTQAILFAIFVYGKNLSMDASTAKWLECP